MKISKHWKTFRYKGLCIILGVYLVMGLILFMERSGIRYSEAKRQVAYMEKEEVVTAKEVAATLDTTCLILMDSRVESSVVAIEQFRQIFLDMKVGYRVVDVSAEPIPDPRDYETVVVLLTNLSTLGDSFFDLVQWVQEGGDMMFALTLEKETYSSILEQKLDIISSDYKNARVEAIYLDENFMLGGGRSYRVSDPFNSAWTVELGDHAVVHAWTDDERRLPLIWENTYGDGKFVVDNFGLYEKGVRGFYAASYSLLTEVCAYPVINGATFYLDDFPSPVPSGNGTYIKRDYGTSIADFYTNIWWPDILGLAQKHGIKYTGAIIENYGDETDQEVVRQEDTTKFDYFGSMLLHQGGEIGYHGYNHQPLCLSNVDYKDVLPYNTWDSYISMKKAVKELVSFGEETFPSTEKTVYVPPSNVLSREGRQMLAKEFPEIKTIASTYFSGEYGYVQEFEVAEDGIVEQPRIISSCIIDDYMQMAAVSELNMHFVSAHFMHPDDLLDEDRGAAQGWEKLKRNLTAYMDWLFESAPLLRRLTGSEMAGAIQRYSGLTVTTQRKGDTYTFHLENLYDEAYLMVRMNEGTPDSITGGELQHLTGNLYLLCAKEDEVTMKCK